MHSGPRWDRGSRRRVGRVHLRGNWPDAWVLAVMLITLLGVVAVFAFHSWLPLMGPHGE